MNDMIHILETHSGIRFGCLGEKPTSPAPTLIVIGNELEYSLTNNEINEVGKLLESCGVKCFAIDVPCHGADQREQEPEGLKGWRSRLENEENMVLDFKQRISEVLNFLIQQGYSDSGKIGLAGTSRGGFLALHFMAAEPRVRCAVAFAPVTELTVLEEFHGLELHPLTRSLDLIHQSVKLAGKPMWMCIGNNDWRVGTDRLMKFTHSVSSLVSKGIIAPVELHVMPTDGHYTHTSAHSEAAAWLKTHLIEAPAPNGTRNV